jgi:hypothetical protein
MHGWLTFKWPRIVVPLPRTNKLLIRGGRVTAGGNDPRPNRAKPLISNMIDINTDYGNHLCFNAAARAATNSAWE